MTTTTMTTITLTVPDDLADRLAGFTTDAWADSAGSVQDTHGLDLVIVGIAGRTGDDEAGEYRTADAVNAAARQAWLDVLALLAAALPAITEARS